MATTHAAICCSERVSFRNWGRLLSAAWELSACAQWVIRYILPYNLPWSHWRGVEVQFYSFFNLNTRWGWVVNATLQLLYPWEWPDTPYIGGWVGPQGQSGWVQKVTSPTPGFDHHIVQLYAILAYVQWVMQCDISALRDGVCDCREFPNFVLLDVAL